MARKTLALSVGSATVGAENFGSPHVEPDVSPTVAAATYTTDKAAFEAALAVLVADAASPTQAHVTTANNAYTTFKAELGGNPVTVDVMLSFDAAKVTTISALRRACFRLLDAARETGMTP